MLFSDGGLGETVLWAPKRGFPQYRLGPVQLVRRTGMNDLAVDADDRLMDGALERIRSAIEKYPCDLILYDLECIRLNGEVERFTVPLSENYLYTGVEKKKICEQTVQNNYINSMCTKAVSRKIVDIDTDYTPWKELQIGEDIFQDPGNILCFFQCRRSIPFYICIDPAVFFHQPDAFFQKSQGLTRTLPDFHFPE